jgi:hypothetical protein
MPAQSTSQARTARVALQVKRQKMSLGDVEPAGFRKAVQSMMSMSESQLQDFTHTKKGGGVMSGRRRMA